MDELKEAIQALVSNKVVVHVSVKRSIGNYESVEVEAWHTVPVPADYDAETRVALQEYVQREALAAAEAEAEESVQRHTAARLETARLAKEEEERRKAEKAADIEERKNKAPSMPNKPPVPLKPTVSASSNKASTVKKLPANGPQGRKTIITPRPD
jgi:hypothetical protein